MYTRPWKRAVGITKKFKQSKKCISRVPFAVTLSPRRTHVRLNPGNQLFSGGLLTRVKISLSKHKSQRQTSLISPKV